jgi:uncharacterized membrane protein YhaH (DUF805 family)
MFAGGLIALLMAFFLVFLIISLVVYIVSSLIYMKIAKKAGYPSPGLAWIPVVGPALIASKIAQMHWWPILLLIGFIIHIIGPVFTFVFAIFMLIWTWKVFKAFGKPGWLVLLTVIPLINLIPTIMLLVIAFGSSTYTGPNLQAQNQKPQTAQKK